MKPTSNDAIAQMTPNSNGVRGMLGLSLHGWENSMVVFLIIAGLFALLAGAATWAVVRLQRIEIAESQQELDLYKLEAGDKISAADALGKAAQEAAAKATAETAKANERAASLERDAADARPETEKLKAAVSWRTLPPDNLARLTASLGEPKGTVLVGYTSGDPEALFLGIQIAKAFENAQGWSIGADARTYPDRILWGLYIPGNGRLVEHVRAAFKAANIAFSTDDVPEPPMRFGPQQTADMVLIFVGSKQPPL